MPRDGGMDYGKQFSGKTVRFPEKNFILSFVQAIEQKILSQIYGRGLGWAFTKTDFVAGFGEAEVAA